MTVYTKNKTVKLLILVILSTVVSCSNTTEPKLELESNLYSGIDFGEHAVGFKIIKIYDQTRYMVNNQNMFGEDIQDNRHRPIYIHLWYPAVASGDHISVGESMVFSESDSDNLNYTDEEYNIATQLHKSRISNFYGEASDSLWVQLLEEPMKAEHSPAMKEGTYPLLIGHLRSFSTDITNEYLASHGYMVAHVRNLHDLANMEDPDVVAREIIGEYRDLEVVIAHLNEEGAINADQIGTFGFSGSGFLQMHLAMMNPNIDAIADLESGYFMEGLWDWLTASPTFEKANLNIPFLHIFSDTLSQEEVMLDEFRTMNYSDRYRLILNEPVHHWDFATEGFLSAGYMGMRGELGESITQSFKISNMYLKEFFDAFLKNDVDAKEFMESSPTENGFNPQLVEMEYLPAVYQTPTFEELIYAMEQPDFERATKFIIQQLKADTASGLENQMSGLNLLAGKYGRAADVERTIAVVEIINAIQPGADGGRQQLDNLGYNYLNKGDSETAIRVFRKNIELNSDHHIPYYSLGDAYAKSGRKEEALVSFERGLQLANEADNYPENLLNAHRRAFQNQIDNLKNSQSNEEN